ncbi:hypothetical protein HY449_03180 [Candidatus Pacearchaeota archaeon]|nr:hypothetical protein [Candidatus Pacearchaeota archaeon]
MNKQIIFLIFTMTFLAFAFNVSAIQQPLVYYKLNLDYNYGNITINSSSIELSNKILDNNFGFYTASVLDFNGNLINLTFFDVPNQIIYDTVDSNGTINGGGQLELNQTNFDIFVPYYKNAREVKIYNQNLSELTKIDVSEFSKEIQKVENVSKTPESGKETGKKEIPTESLTDKIAKYWWALVIVLVVLIGYLFYSLTGKR